MTSCKDIYGFLTQVSNKSVTGTLSPPDAQLLSQLGIVQFLSSDQYRQVADELRTLDARRAALSQEMAQRAQAAQTVSEDATKTHSILFHLHGKATQTAELQREAQDRASLASLTNDLTQKEQAFNALVAKRAVLDTLTAYSDQYVGLTSIGVANLRKLGIRMYRVSDTDFATYWDQTQRITTDLNLQADGGAGYYARLAPALGSDADRSCVWGISLGLSKSQPDVGVGQARFQDSYNGLRALSGNTENRLMAAEIVFALPQAPAEAVTALAPLLHDVRKLGVPSESALGIGAILLFGRRGDGTFATANLGQFLRVTRSFESAALLAIVNAPIPDLTAKFQSLRGLFASWGYQPSEDVELASAYLTVSELPADTIGTKLAIIAKGMGAYLQYPLVAAAILAAVSTIEANETLNLVEEAYGVIGRRAAGLSQAELICLSVRMVHGIRNELVGNLDTTATARPRVTPSGAGGRFIFLPVVVGYHGYFATYSGIGGAHPGHVHGVGGVGGGG